DNPLPVRLDDNHILKPDGRGVLDGLVSGDNPAIFVDQNAAASPVLPQTALNLRVAALRSFVSVTRVRRQVRELRNCVALFQIPPQLHFAVTRAKAAAWSRGLDG